jgi:hypothetical protein
VSDVSSGDVNGERHKPRVSVATLCPTSAGAVTRSRRRPVESCERPDDRTPQAIFDQLVIGVTTTGELIGERRRVTEQSGNVRSNGHSDRSSL